MLQVQQPIAEPPAGAESLLGEAMIYILLLSFSAGIGLLVAAAVGYVAWGKWQARGARKVVKNRRQGA